METQVLIEENIEHDNNYDKESCQQSLDTKKDISDSPIKLSKLKKTARRSSEKFNEIKQKLREVSVDDLKKLCEQISTLNERILNAREITYLRYDLPMDMKDKLEMEAQELECLYAEMKDATRNLEIIKVQRAALGKERQWMQEQIDKLKAEAVTEMEMIVSVYDSQMMERWEGVKQSNSVSQVENFLHDVKGKLEAMKNLQILGTNKLAELHNVEKKKSEVITKKERKRINREERSAGQVRGTRSGSSLANHSQTTFDTEFDDLLDESTVLDNVMFNIMYDHVLNMHWTSESLDVD